MPLDRWLDERRPTLMLQPLDDDAGAKDLLAGLSEDELVRHFKRSIRV